MSTTQRQAWYAVSAPGGTTLRCAECKNDIDLGQPEVDHHPRVCPACGVESAFLNWKDRTIQIVLKNAPHAFAEAIRWSQRHLDELEYVELLCAFEEIADALNGASVHK
jgi:hypothetical protein